MFTIPPISDEINKLYRNGKTIKEIQKITGLSAASVSGYLPYQKTVYNLEVTTDVAIRLRKYRARRTLTDKLSDSADLTSEQKTDLLWETLIAFED